MKTDNLTPAARIKLLADKYERCIPTWPHVFVTVAPENLAIVNDLISAVKQADYNQGKEPLTYWLAVSGPRSSQYWEAPLPSQSVTLALLNKDA